MRESVGCFHIFKIYLWFGRNLSLIKWSLQPYQHTKTQNLEEKLDIFNDIWITDFYVTKKTIKKVKRYDRKINCNMYSQYNWQKNFQRKGKGQSSDCPPSLTIFMTWKKNVHFQLLKKSTQVGVCILQMKTLGSERLSDLLKVTQLERGDEVWSPPHTAAWTMWRPALLLWPGYYL